MAMAMRVSLGERKPKQIFILHIHREGEAFLVSQSPIFQRRREIVASFFFSFSKLSSFRRQWSSTSSTARSHATCLVNAYLSRTYLPSMELGVLSSDDMPGFRSKASLKLARQQQLHLNNLLSSFRDMVSVGSKMVTCGKSMRCYLKGTSTSPLVQFSVSSDLPSDSGDGGGVPVFALWPISRFEEYADEVVQMLVLELNLKIQTEVAGEFFQKMKFRVSIR